MSVVDEWVQKAEADYQSAIDLYRSRRALRGVGKASA